MTDWNKARRAYFAGPIDVSCIDDAEPHCIGAPSHIERIALALERIADAMEREAPEPDEHEEGLTPVGELMLDGSRV